MKFIDSNNPPKKGEFEYKPSKYGSIFAYNETDTLDFFSSILSDY